MAKPGPDYNLQPLADELRAAEEELDAAKEAREKAERAEWSAKQRADKAREALRAAIDRLTPQPRRGLPAGE